MPRQITTEGSLLMIGHRTWVEFQVTQYALVSRPECHLSAESPPIRPQAGLLPRRVSPWVWGWAGRIGPHLAASPSPWSSISFELLLLLGTALSQPFAWPAQSRLIPICICQREIRYIAVLLFLLVTTLRQQKSSEGRSSWSSLPCKVGSRLYLLVGGHISNIRKLKANFCGGEKEGHFHCKTFWEL